MAVLLVSRSSVWPRALLLAFAATLLALLCVARPSRETEPCKGTCRLVEIGGSVDKVLDALMLSL